MNKLLGIVIAFLTLFAAGTALDKGCSGEKSAERTRAPGNRLNLAWPPPDVESGAPGLVPDYGAKNYYVVFDGSGSMSYSDCAPGSTKLDVAKKAVADFAHALPEDANLGLMAFDGAGITERVPLGTGNRAEFASEIGAVLSGGGTPLNSSVRMGYEKLTRQARRQLGYGEYHLVVVTDGEAWPEDEDPSSAVDEALTQSPVVLHTVGFCIGESHSLNQPGRTLYYPADNSRELNAGLKNVLAESESFDVKNF